MSFLKTIKNSQIKCTFKILLYRSNSRVLWMCLFVPITHTEKCSRVIRFNIPGFGSSKKKVILDTTATNSSLSLHTERNRMREKVIEKSKQRMRNCVLYRAGNVYLKGERMETGGAEYFYKVFPIGLPFTLPSSKDTKPIFINT